VKIIRYPDSGKSKGFGFIEMANDDEADAAIQKLNGTDVQGRSIRVNVARPKKNGE
jgi:RNA recognition motif-containing protein